MGGVPDYFHTFLKLTITPEGTKVAGLSLLLLPGFSHCAHTVTTSVSFCVEHAFNERLSAHYHGSRLFTVPSGRTIQLTLLS